MIARQRIGAALVVAGLMAAGVALPRLVLDSDAPERAQREATAATQRRLAQEVETAAPVLHRRARPVDVGTALATLRIPRFGADWLWVVSEGVTPAVLDGGPGHYPGTAVPGQRGNVAIAAHRAGHGDPFIDFDLLVPGDRVIFEARGIEWSYVITKAPVIIDPEDVWVLDRYAPGKTLTLTTCWPKYGSERRMYVRARLIERTTS